MYCTLKHGRHYCGGRVQLNTFTPTVEAEMLGLITGSSRPLRQTKVVCVNVEVIQSESTYDTGFGRKNNNMLLLSYLCSLDVEVL